MMSLNKLIPVFSYIDEVYSLYEDKNSPYVGYILNNRGKPYKTYITPGGKEIEFKENLLLSRIVYEIITIPRYTPIEIYKLRAHIGRLNQIINDIPT